MSMTKTKLGVAGAVALIAACIPCCISLAAPILAWLGITSIGAAAGWYWSATGIFALGAAAVLFVRHRRGASCQVRPRRTSCVCGPGCSSK
jgi:hypothetical protein